MNSILKLSTPLLRNENWRIRESIHYHCSTTPKKRSLWKCVANDEGLKGNYDGLLKLFQSEDLWQEAQPLVVSMSAISFEREDETKPCASNSDDERQGLGDNDFNVESANTSKVDGTGIDRIRHVPEIMMRVYAYLSLGDRIYRLSLVDRTFSKDKLRSGIVNATYGGGFNLHQALLELRRWAIEEMRKQSAIDTAEFEEPIAKRQSGTVLPSSPTSKQDQWFHTTRISKILRMLKATNLTDSEPLLYVRSNLKNTLVTPGKRREWMTRHIQKFFASDDWELQHKELPEQRGQSWWTSIALVETFLRRYFFDGRVNRLEQLVEEVDFVSDYEQYKECQFRSSTDISSNEKLVWCLPDLSPGCNLLLPDHPDDTADAPSGTFGGWREYRFVSCGRCRTFHEQSKSTVVRCRHGHQRYFCNVCYHRSVLSTHDSADDPCGTVVTTVVDRCIHPPKLRSMICAHCRRAISRE